MSKDKTETKQQINIEAIETADYPETNLTVDMDVKVPEDAFNFAGYEAFAQEIDARLDFYRGHTVTAENLKLSKEHLADLRRIAREINDERITIGKQWNKPYQDFKDKVDTLVQMIDEVVGNIDGQVKEIEQAAIDEKIEDAKAFFEECKAANPNLDWLTFDQHYTNPKIKNKTYPLFKVQDDIRRLFAKVRKGIESIKAINDEDFEFEMIDKFKESLDLAEAIQHGQKCREEKERKEKYEAERAAKKQKQAEIAQEQKTVQAPETAQQAENDVSDDIKVFALSFRVTGTKQQLIALSDYMKQQGLKFEPIEA